MLLPPQAKSANVAGGRGSRRLRFGLGLVALGLAAAIVAGLRAGKSMPAPPEGVSQRQFDLAARAYQQRYRREPDYFDVISWLAESEFALGEREQARRCFELIPSTHPRYGRAARLQQGEAAIHLHRAREAEQNFREFLQLEHEHPQRPPQEALHARQQLRHLLEVQLRFEERHELLREMTAAGEADAFETVAYCFPTLLLWNGRQTVTWLEQFLAQDPDDFALRVAHGRYLTSWGQLPEASAVLEKCCAEKPDDLPAQAALLEYWRAQNDWGAMEAVLEKLPPASDADPWLLSRLRGHFCNHLGQYEAALACFDRVLRTDPSCAECRLGQAQAWAGLERPNDRQRALHAANVLARIQNRLGWVQSGANAAQPLSEIAELCLAIDLVDHARIVMRLLERTSPNHAGLRRLRSRLPAAKPAGGTRAP
jgi:tetratricopeptide (TPR) repeat protein